MRQTLSFGVLAMLLSGSSMLPGLGDIGRAASLETDSTAATVTEVAIRQAGEAAPEDQTPADEVPVPVAPLPQPRVIKVRTGQASWYGPGFYGRRTASGERLSQGTLTAAHPYLPFGTKVRVTNLRNGRSEVVRINDRGPFHGGRIIDLAHGAAHAIGLVSSGVARVKLEVLAKH